MADLIKKALELRHQLERESLPHIRLVYFLCQLKGACNIPVDRLAGLLQKAVQRGNCLDIQSLTSLPAACQLDRSFVRQLVVDLKTAALNSVHKDHALTRLQGILLFGGKTSRRHHLNAL